MKVSTDGCLLGATAFHNNPNRTLDIGTGTGLLTLMIAQRYSNTFIDAIEIEQDAYHQACNNVTASPWADRINVIHNRIQDYSITSNQKYELIISNPPFYIHQKATTKEKDNIARHASALNLEELAKTSSGLLKDDGSLFVIYPQNVSDDFERMAMNYGLLPFYKMYIHNRPETIIIRRITGYRKVLKELFEEQLIIRNSPDDYSYQFKKMLKDFYLAF